MNFKKHILSLLITFIFLIPSASADTGVVDKQAYLLEYSVLATNSVHFKKGARVISGYVGVNDRSVNSGDDDDDGDDDDENHAGLIVGMKVRTEAAVTLKAPGIVVRRRARVKGDVYYRDNLDIHKTARILGQTILLDDPNAWPLVSLPGDSVCQPDMANPVLIARGAEGHLNPGAYGDIRVRRKGTLVLEGGTYHINTLRVGQEARVIFKGASEVCVAGHVLSRARAFIGADPEDENVKAGDIQIIVRGDDLDSLEEDHRDEEEERNKGKHRGKHRRRHKESEEHAAVKIGKKSVVFAQIRALNGTIRIKKAVQATGAYVARDVVIGRGSVIRHDTTPTATDTVAPQILSVMPAEGSVIDTLTPVISASFSDNDSGVDVSSVQIALNNQDETAQANVTAAGFSFTAALLSEGGQVLEISVSDLAGNTARLTVQFTIAIDTFPPEITGIQPVDGAILKDALPTLSAGFSDADSGVDLSGIQIFLDNNDITSLTGVTETGFAYTVGTALPDGAHSFSISVNDLAGNNTQAAVTFITDVSPPDVSILIPSDGSILGQATPEISGQWSDTATALDLASAKIRVDGIDVTSDAVLSAAGFQMSLSVPLNDGIHTLSVEITDAAGNTGQISSGFTTDTIAPVLSNISPPDGSTVTANVPTISLNFTDATSGVDIAAVQLTVDNTDVTTQSSITETSLTYTPASPLSDGPHHVMVSVADIADNTAVINFSFTVLTDNVPPTITNINPSNGQFVNTANPTLSADFEDNLTGVDPASVQILLDAVDVTAQASVSASGFSLIPTGLSEGQHSLSISLSDNRNNQAQAGSSFTVDMISPQITIQRAPLPNASGWNNGDVTIGFLATDAGSGVGSVDPVVALTMEGANQSVTGTATDLAGNSASVSTQVNIDKTPPVLTIISPVDGSTQRGAQVVISGTVRDMLSGVGSIGCNSSSAVVTGNNFTCEVILIDGVNRINVVNVHRPACRQNDSLSHRVQSE